MMPVGAHRLEQALRHATDPRARQSRRQADRERRDGVGEDHEGETETGEAAEQQDDEHAARHRRGEGDQAGQAEQQNRDDAERAVHRHRCHGSRARYRVAPHAQCAHRIAANARKRGPDERADEEHAHDRAERRRRISGERPQEQQPSPRHQGAVEEHEGAGPEQPRGRGRQREARNGRRVALPEDDAGEAGGNSQPHGAAGKELGHCVAGRVSACLSGLCLTL